MNSIPGRLTFFLILAIILSGCEKKDEQVKQTEAQPVATSTVAVSAALLPAEEMQRELDAKGHVALYINFDFDKADIRLDSQPIIDEVVKLLKNNPALSLTIEGHTDNVGAPDYNRRLSDARARSVLAALINRAIEAGRLEAVGHGQDKPIADNSAEEGRAKNRRVELVKM